jgi:hypothetical protein
MPRSRAVAGPRRRRDVDRPRVYRSRGGRTGRHSSRTAVHPALNGLLAAGSALLSTFGVVLIVVAAGWVFAADHTSLRGMVTFAVDTWLAAHLLPIEVGDVSWWLPPLLLTAAIVGSGYWVGREAVRRGLPTSREAMRDFWIAMIGGYAAAATLLAAVSATAVTAVPLLATPFATAAVFGCGAVVGVARANRSYRALERRVPVRIRAEVAAALTGVALLLGGSAALFAAAAATSGRRIAEGFELVQPGLSGTALLILISVIYLPTMLIWVASFALGVGFAVGINTLLAPWSVQSGEVPAVPLLNALPTQHSWWFALALVLPVLAALAARRALPLAPGASLDDLRSAAVSLARTAGFAAAVMGLLAVLADGGIGGRLSQMGPSPLLVMAATGAWFIVVFTLVEGWQALWLRHRRNRARTVAAREDGENKLEDNPNDWAEGEHS